MVGAHSDHVHGVEGTVVAEAGKRGNRDNRDRRDDVALARRCVLGDPAAQRELFHREKRRVHVILFRVLGSNAEMEDLLQEVFIEIFRSIQGFRGEAALGTWIDRIAVRVAYGYLTRRRVERLETVRLSVVPEPPSHDPSAEERAMTREAAAHLYGALHRIPDLQRVAFALHVLDGRPMKEVAANMDATVVATKVRVWRAWRAVRGAANRDPLIRDLLRWEGPLEATER